MLPKGVQTGETYSVFGTKKQGQVKTQVCLFNFDAKKVGDYDLNGKISKVEMTNENNLYVVADEKLMVYKIDVNAKNRL